MKADHLLGNTINYVNYIFQEQSFLNLMWIMHYFGTLIRRCSSFLKKKKKSPVFLYYLRLFTDLLKPVKRSLKH